MILVYLPNKTQSTALHAASDVVKHIRQEEKLFCPACESQDLYYSRKSQSDSKWMEIEARCGVCGTRFSLPDNVLQGFWRNGDKKGEITVERPLRFTESLNESLVGGLV